MINNPILYYIKGFDPIPADKEKILLRELSEDKAKRIQRLVFAKDRSRSLYGLLLLRKIMHKSGYTDFTLKHVIHPKNEKPYIDKRYNPEKVDFNITHSGEIVACAAISGALIGLDTEWMQNKQHRLSEHFMTPEEIAWVGKSEARFLELWTQKEALIKVDPKGKLMQLKSIKILSANKGRINHRNYHLQSLKISKSTFTHIACSKKIEQVEFERISIQDL